MKNKDLKFKEKIKNKLTKLIIKDEEGLLLEPVKQLNESTYLIFNEIKTDKKGLFNFAKILKEVLNSY